MTAESTIQASEALSDIPPALRQPLVKEFNKLLRNFRERRWEPAELDGGRFAEIAYSILDGHVRGKFASAPYKPANMYQSCRDLEAADKTTFPRSIRIQIPRILIALYEIRNNRNVGHVGGDVDPNHMDASVVVEMVKWVMAELVRIFHNTTTEEATLVVEALIERTMPILWRVNGKVRVLNPNLPFKDKALVVLCGSPVAITVSDLVSWLEYSNASVFRKKVLKPLHDETLVDFDEKSDEAVISPTGIRYVEEHIELSV